MLGVGRVGLVEGWLFAVQTWPRGPPIAPAMPLQINLVGRNLREAHSPSEDGLRDKRKGGRRPVASHVHCGPATVRHYRTDARRRSAERQRHTLLQPIYLHLHMC